MNMAQLLQKILGLVAASVLFVMMSITAVALRRAVQRLMSSCSWLMRGSG